MSVNYAKWRVRGRTRPTGKLGHVARIGAGGVRSCQPISVGGGFEDGPALREKSRGFEEVPGISELPFFRTKSLQKVAPRPKIRG
ncbi:MAG: hypothetical protein NTV15_01760 [Candidatus Bathyarchaeota archaeon]|nr:hypothetical protein [Candidatus Bathyarchaeota archaeon]